MVRWFLLATVLVGCSEDPPQWSTVFEGMRSGLLRAWGSSSEDVYIVGADAEGTGPEVLHFDGDAWKSLASGANGDLWWVQGVGPDDIRMVGEDGLVVRYTPSSGKFEVKPTPTQHTLFGVWGSSSTDVWYVGGSPGLNQGVILRDDGSQIVEVMHTSTASAAFFKVYGFGPEAVWLVGQRGTALFWNGSELMETDTQTFLPLMGVHGTAPDRVFAVGGVSDGAMLAWNGSTWQQETPADAVPQMFGVWAAKDDVYACGFNGYIYKRTGGVWSKLAEKVPTFQDLHAIWIDEAGAIWAVGGRLAERPPSGGVLIRYGSPISTEVE